MLHTKVIVGLCFFTCVIFREVELTPIVQLPLENEPTSTTDFTTVTAIGRESPITTSTTTTFASSSSIDNKLTTLANSTESGESETSSTLLPLQGNYSERASEHTTVQPIIESENINSSHTEEQKVTTPELLIKTESTSTPLSIIEHEVTTLAVTSQSLLLKAVVETNYGSQNVTVPLRVMDNATGSKDTDENYKNRTPLEYHPYIEEILRTDEADENNTSTQSAPIRMKLESYQTPQKNALIVKHPYGHLPKFAETEMNKLRLNHWRVRQILKGDAHYNDHKVGHSGTDKFQGKDSRLFGQKRASSISAVTAPVLLQSSAIDQDEFHTSVLASDADAEMEKENASSSPSKLRTFFNWISNPLKRKPSKEDERLNQARAQEPILPFALGYRGDFLFW